MSRYSFSFELTGEGESPEEAWQQAYEAFIADPDNFKDALKTASKLPEPLEVPDGIEWEPVENQNLTGKFAVLKRSKFAASFDERIIYCEQGFGCAPYTVGSAIFGIMVSGERVRVIRGDIEMVQKN